MKKDITIDGLSKTTYMKDDMEGKIVTKEEVNINPNIQTAFLLTLDNPQFTINTPLWVWWCKPDGFHADIDYLDKQLINWVTKKNMTLLIFTVMTQEQLIKVQFEGIDGIFVDSPHLN